MSTQTQDDLFGGATAEDVTIQDQIAEVERELAMRRSAYPRWVGSGTLRQEAATRQMLAMQSVLLTLHRAAARERW